MIDSSDLAAFPLAVDTNSHQWDNGMTLRDYFAAAALQGYSSNVVVMTNAIEGWVERGGKRQTCIAEYLAGLAYEVADSMLEARK